MSISPEWSGIFNTHSWLKMVPLVQSNMKIYPCYSLAMTGQDSELSQKAVVVGCLIFILSIGHGMAIVPYNATRSSHSSWTLAQSRLKYLLYVPQITHSILASPGTACPHMFNRELAIDIRFLQELPLLFTSTPSLAWSFRACICCEAFEASRNSWLPPGNNKKNYITKALLSLFLRLKIVKE